MVNKPSVLIDLNIILDVLQKYEPFFENSAGLLAAVETGLVDGYVAAHSVTMLFYLIQKAKSSADARAVITNLMQFIKIVPVDQRTLEQSLNLDFRDFEDAVQMISVLRCKADCLIARNIKGYQPALLPVMQPVEFLAALEQDAL
ncbi:MAG: PIN domain-containing protein [Anaerolineaceae bacterium]